MISNKYVYNLDLKESKLKEMIKRKIEIKDLHAVTDGKDCDEFIIHVKGDYDY